MSFVKAFSRTAPIFWSLESNSGPESLADRFLLVSIRRGWGAAGFSQSNTGRHPKLHDRFSPLCEPSGFFWRSNALGNRNDLAT
jgi:hypothetical protein